MNIIIITPTRQRVGNAKRLIESFLGSTHSTLVLCVDNDDPDREAYRELVSGYVDGNVIARFGPRAKLVEWTNRATFEMLNTIDGEIVGSLGDDHVLSEGWEAKVLAHFKNPNVAFLYGDDGIQSENLPTAVFESSDAIRELGYFMLPTLEHMFVDNVWLDLGTLSNTIIYDHTLKIPHLHPLAKRAEWDASYLESNSRWQYLRDQSAYQFWIKSNKIREDARKIMSRFAVKEAVRELSRQERERGIN